MLTDRVHGLIGDKPQRGYTSGVARPPPTGPTLRYISLTVAAHMVLTNA